MFLDLARDRYFQVSERLGEALRALIKGEHAPAADIGELVARRLITEDGEGRPIEPTRRPPLRASVIEDVAGSPPLNWRAAPEAVYRLIRARDDLRRKPFSAIIEDVANEKAEIDRSRRALTPHEAGQLASAFHAARRFTPIKYACLPDSLALLRYLFCRHVTADFVIAVRIRPFHAHCWLQAEGMLLNNALDDARTFTPIRII